MHVSAAGHGSFGGSNRRRMFTMNCTRHANTPHEMATLERYGAKNETLTRRIRDVFAHFSLLHMVISPFCW